MKYTDVEFRELSEYIENNDFDRYLNGKTTLITGSKGLVGTSLVKWILLQNEIKGTNIKITEKRGMRKDRYSSLAYNYWVQCQLERETLRKRKTGFDANSYAIKLKKLSKRPNMY